MDRWARQDAHLAVKAMPSADIWARLGYTMHKLPVPAVNAQTGP